MLKEQLSQQIVTDAEELTKGFKDTNDYEAGIIQGFKDGYDVAGYKYAALWQAAEEMAAKYEKALRELEMQSADLNLALAAMLNGYQNLSIYQRDWFTVPKDLIDNYTKMVLNYDALTPKTGEDE